jgi:hypothetical protein
VLSSVSQHQEVAGGASPQPAQPVTPQPTRAELEAQDRATKAGERKFIRKGALRSDVVARIGVPDARSLDTGSECWYYGAVPGDHQTSTEICFDLGGPVQSVRRGVVR